MNIYFIFLFIMIICRLFVIYKWQRLFGFIFALVLSFFFMFRYRIGTDWFFYSKILEFFNEDFPFFNFFLIVEPGFLLFLSSFSVFSNRGYEVLIFLQGLLILILLIKNLKNQNDPIFFVLIFYVLLFFPLSDVIRQAFAILFSYLFINVSQNRTNLKNSILLSTFHYSYFVWSFVVYISNKIEGFKYSIFFLRILGLLFLLVYTSLGYGFLSLKLPFLEATKYLALFDNLGFDISVYFVVLLSLVLFSGSRKSEVIFYVLLILFGAFSTLWTRFSIYFVFYFLLENNLKFSAKKLLFILGIVSVMFYKNNLDPEVRIFRNWSGFWFFKSEVDDVNKEFLWNNNIDLE